MILNDNRPERIEVMVMFRIISRHDWDTLQSWHKACPGSTIEHLYGGMYALTIPAGAHPANPTQEGVA